MPDRELAGRLADGDPHAPRELVERHYSELYRYARLMLRNSTEAEDAVQEAFVQALSALGKYPAERVRAMRLRAWLYRITLNIVRNRARKRGRAEEVEFSEESVPDTGGADREAVMDTLAALSRLPEKQRAAVTLRYGQDLTFAEISTATGWPESTAKTNVRRGIERLRKELTP
ncbi:MAG: RNA polymerase sigma factor [Rubrobacter sp.]